MWEWLRNALGRSDSEAAPLVLQSQPPVVTQMTAPGMRVSFDELMAMEGTYGPSGYRQDNAAVYNSLTGLGGGGDKGASTRPNTSWRPLTDTEKRIQYRRSALTSRMCGIYASNAFRKGWTIEVADEKDRDRAKRVEKALGDIDLDNKCIASATFANRDGTMLAMGVFDEAPNDYDIQGRPIINLALPPSRIYKVLQVQTFERERAAVAAWDADPRSSAYQTPLVWSLFPMVGGGSYWNVHRSRILWFRGSELSPVDLYANAGFDDSLIDTWWQELSQKLSIGQIGATIAAELSVKVLKIAGKAGASSEDQARTFFGRLSMWWRSMSVGNIGVIGADDEVIQAGSTVTGFAELTEEAWTALAAISDIPRTVLTGEPPGGLNADGQAQRECWHAAVHFRQVFKYEPVLRQAIGWAWQAEGGPPEEWSVRWSQLDEPTEKEQADTYKTYAEADGVYLDKGVLLPATVTGRFAGPTFNPQITLTDDIREAKKMGNLALSAQKLLEKNAEAQGAGSPGTGGGPRKTPTGESET